VALILFVVAALVPAVASTQEPVTISADVRTIRVSGFGEFRAQPDLATVQFAVETTGITAQEAGQQNATSMERVIQALVGAGIRREDIRTSGYSLQPVYAPQPRQPSEIQEPRITGYRASNQVSARIAELDRVGQLIDIGLEAGANSLNGVYFELQNAERAQAQALERAVAAARVSAQTMAGALGVTLGNVLDASTTSEPVRPMFRAARDMEMTQSFAPSTPIEPGEQTVTASAFLVFEIR
jgi:uncharacterized protein YggE